MNFRTENVFVDICLAVKIVKFFSVELLVT